MIPRTRTKAADAVAALTKPDSKGKTERDKMVGHIERRSPRKKPEYGNYRERSVKNELNSIFVSKCAYCESRYEHVTPMDVEHYRPKSAVLGDDGKLHRPGYYWLGAEWTNLLPSCVSCNRVRTLKVWDSRQNLVETLAGKGNKFPVKKGTKRASKPSRVRYERPLLLDPTRDDPAKHLEFTDEGFVRPRLGPTERNTPKGETTIEVMALSRATLVEERKAGIKHLMAPMKTIVRSKVRLQRDPNDTGSQDDLNDAERDLKLFFAPDKAYLALCRQLRRSFRAVLRDIEAYWGAREAYNERDTSARTKALERAATKLKRYLADYRADCHLAAEMLVWARIRESDGTWAGE